MPAITESKIMAAEEKKAVPCKKCGAKPRLLCIDGLYYAQCTGMSKRRITLMNGEKSSYSVKCDKWGPYEFLATTPRVSIENWNYANSSRIINYDDL